MARRWVEIEDSWMMLCELDRLGQRRLSCYAYLLVREELLQDIGKFEWRMCESSVKGCMLWYVFVCFQPA